MNPLAELFSGMLSSDNLREIVGKLQSLGYLKSGRAGEYRPGERLNRLFDLQATEHAPLSIYSNIEMSGAGQIKIRDHHSRRVVARVDRQWLERDVLTLEGRPLEIEWYDGEALWVSAYRGGDAASRLRYMSARQVLGYTLAQLLPAQLGLEPRKATLISYEDGWLLFHWLGDVYGRALLDLMSYTLAVEETVQPGLCLRLWDEPRTLPPCEPERVRRYLRDHYRRYEPMLALGAYHSLLPANLRRRAVEAQFGVEQFVRATNSLSIERASEDATQELGELII